MKDEKSIGSITFDILNTLLMACVFIALVYPFIYVINASISSKGALSGSLMLIPKDLTMEAYKSLFKDGKIVNAFFISVARSTIGPLIMIMVTGMAAYVLSIPNLVCGKFFRTYFVLTMYVTAGIIPNYIFMKKYGLMDNFLVYIFPRLCDAFNIVLIKTYIESIPSSLREAVYVDGGNDFQAYWRVIFPVCKPINAAILLFGILDQWNCMMDTQMYCAMTEKLHTLQYVLYNTLQSMTNIEALKAGAVTNVGGQNIKMAITVITVLPVMFVYPSLQKHFASGIMLGSVKA